MLSLKKLASKYGRRKKIAKNIEFVSTMALESGESQSLTSTEQNGSKLKQFCQDEDNIEERERSLVLVLADPSNYSPRYHFTPNTPPYRHLSMRHRR